MKFSEVIGQQNVKNRLLAMAADGRVPHAMLFLGSEGSGALPLALAFAQYLDCVGDKSGGDSCGVCPACQKVAKLVHPDVHSVFPMVKAGQSDDSDTYLPEWRQMLTTRPYFSLNEWTDAMSLKKTAKPDPDEEADAKAAGPTGKQALIAKNAAQTIHAKLSMKPYEAQRQILILWKPELMNEATSNSLLKILEEPPADTLFLLVSEDAASILPTILSRTQVFKVPPIDDQDMVPAICRRFNLQPDAAARLAHIAQGSFVAAQNIAEGAEEAHENLDLFRELMRSAYKADVVQMNKLAERFKTSLNREQVKNALLYCRRMIRESFILNLAHTQLNFLTDEEEQFLTKFAPFVHVGNVEQLTALIDDTYAQVAQNGNIKMVMKTMVLQLTALIRRSQRPKSSD